MRITKIYQLGKQDRFMILVDNKLAATISASTVLDMGLVVGDRISEEKIQELNTKSFNDDLRHKALKFVSIRVRSENELKMYLKRKGANPSTLNSIFKNFKELGLVNDQDYTKAYIHDALIHSPSSRRKIAYQLQKKQISEEIIHASLNQEVTNDQDSLKQLIVSKRRQSRYQDDLKLMSYLVRIGFNYVDVKEAIKNIPDEDQ